MKRQDVIFGIGCLVILSPMLYLMALWPGIHERETVWEAECTRMGGIPRKERAGNICLQPSAVIDVRPKTVQ